MTKEELQQTFAEHLQTEAGVVDVTKTIVEGFYHLAGFPVEMLEQLDTKLAEHVEKIERLSTGANPILQRLSQLALDKIAIDREVLAHLMALKRLGCIGTTEGAFVLDGPIPVGSTDGLVRIERKGA